MRFIACVLVSVFAFAAVPSAKATDLRPVQYVLLYGQLRALMAAQLAIEIANDNRLAAVDYTVNVQIRNKATGVLVFQGAIPGQNISPYSRLTLLLSQLWFPATSGLFTVTTSIAFADDINPSNNTITQDATVYPPVLLAALFLNAYVRPFVNLDRSHSTFQYRYGPSNVYRYLNVRAWSVEGLAYWILRNQAVPPSQDSVTMRQNIDLHDVLESVDVDSLKFSYDLADTTIRTDTGLTAYRWMSYDTIQYDQGGVRDTAKRSVKLTPITIPIGETITDGLVWGCRVPNLELDSASHPYNAETDFAGDLNACAPTSAANSLQWLEQEFPMQRSGLTHREKMEELGRLMRRERETGVWSEDFLRGKLAFINKYDLPIKVKFQQRGRTSDAESEDDYIKTAKNQGDGGYPKWDWLKKEVKDSEDVEVFVEYHVDSASGSQVTGRHAIVITGASQSATGKDLWYKDDARQRRAGGTQERKVSWDTLAGGVPYFDGWKGRDGRAHATVPYFACSESYDSSVHRVGRSTLNKLWRGFKGFVFGTEADTGSIDHKASTSLRFANAFSPYLPAALIQNVPVGDKIGERVTVVVDSSHFKQPVKDSLWMNVWYADTIRRTTPLDTIPRTRYRIIPSPDSTKYGALTTGTESWRPGPGSLIIPTWTEGSFTVADTNLRWLGFDVSDIDSTNTRTLYPDTLGDRGSSGQAGIADILRILDTTSTQVMFPDTRVQRRVTLTEKSERGRQGTVRTNMIKGALDYVDEVRQPIRVRFQSASVSETEIKATSTSHSAKNETGVSRAPDAAWMAEHLRTAPLLVELGWYNSSGRRHGTWAVLNGWMNYNGVTRVIMDRDFDEGHTGGLHRTIGTIVPDNGALCVLELASLAERCIIESAVSLSYDPTIVFTGVAEDVAREIGSVTVSPNPAQDVLAIHAELALSHEATLSIYTMLGEQIVQRSVSSNALMSRVQLKIDSIPTGQYIVRISTGRAVFTQPFVRVQ